MIQRQCQGISIVCIFMVCHQFQATPTHIKHKGFIRGYTLLLAPANIHHLTYHLSIGHSQWLLFVPAHIMSPGFYIISPWPSRHLQSYNMLSYNSNSLPDKPPCYISHPQPSMDSKNRTINPTETVVKSIRFVFLIAIAIRYSTSHS